MATKKTAVPSAAQKAAATRRKNKEWQLNHEKEQKKRRLVRLERFTEEQRMEMETALCSIQDRFDEARERREHEIVETTAILVRTYSWNSVKALLDQYRVSIGIHNDVNDALHLLDNGGEEIDADGTTLNERIPDEPKKHMT